MKTATVKTQELTDQMRIELLDYAEKTARICCAVINQIVPESVEGMRYARQWVLEETIKKLEKRV
ncbi:MAG: hypothetical protein WC373_04690 [Smithella sp.]|jgi:hypothetical protein